VIGDRTIVADRCWLATGTAPDIRADEALAGAVDHHVDGVPVLDHDLRVGSNGLFVAGRLAMIELGPAAGNLWGARMAARRISRAIVGVDLRSDDTVQAEPSADLAPRTGGTR
jgi:hypothetical protein